MAGFFALGIRLRLDACDVRFSCCNAHGAECDPTTRLIGRNEDKLVVAHCCGLGVKKAITDVLTFCVGSCHRIACCRVDGVAGLVLLTVVVDSIDRCFDPLVHRFRSFASKTVALPILLESLYCIIKTMDSVLVLGFPALEVAVGPCVIQKGFELVIVG
ncbi:hypothetical protein CYJ22_06255 [Schaalia odontolytica]|uniref:Uncharacterized protein n=1 Tax=Schaalia odontolytica TaxID=1660 RepID=A0A2I1HZW2_9ACTO|nr:hypothetical protein CYJ22_06255 [Schaalia odontolytica]